MKLMRCVRVIEYIGPEDWIRETLQQSAVGPKGTRFKLGPDKQITEIARTTKVVSDAPVSKTWGGIRVKTDPTMDHSTIRIEDDHGNVLGSIINIGEGGSD